MNRRSFLKGIGVAAAGFAIPEIILPADPEKRFWVLNADSIPPKRGYSGDSAFIQWHVDRDRYLPIGVYELDEGVVVGPEQIFRIGGKGSTYFHSALEPFGGALLTVKNTPDRRDMREWLNIGEGGTFEIRFGQQHCPPKKDTP